MQSDTHAWSIAKGINRLLPTGFAFNTKRIGLIGGQDIFTPEDISKTELIKDDRPYAGWLYAGVSLIAIRERQTNPLPFISFLDVLDILEIDMGVVGPASLAEDVQVRWHNFINIKTPNGWENQLDNEPGVIIAFERKWRFPQATFSSIQLDLTPNAGFELGNVFTSLSIGATLRLGEGLFNDFGPPRIRPATQGADFYASGDKFRWYLFGSIEGRAVGRNIFLDGNTFSNSHHVEKKPFIGDLQGGLVVMLWRHVRLTATYVYRDKEFRGQKKADQFGALGLSFTL